GQFFGNALYEEILFRAFLITQMLVLIKKKKRKWSWNRCFLIALLGSQVIFALIHIPNRLYQGSYTGVGSFFADQFILVILGSLLAGVFLLSRNVYAAIGIHALVNKAAVFFVLPSEDLKLSAFLVIPLMILANRMKAKSKKKDEKA
ncbi:MAG: CPBP family intramembrane glutamic endopeptidase, partial [Planctomycetota bacterium]